LIDLQVFRDFIPTLVETWLGRSQQAPLSVILSNFPYTIPFFESPPVRTVFEQSHRWRIVDIQLWAASMDVFFPLRNNLPELEELHLRFAGPGFQLEGLDFFGTAPKLHRVTLLSSLHHFIDMKLPWAQLTQFVLKQIGGRSITTLCALLQLAPNLLEVNWPLRKATRTNLSTIVQHSRLRDFSVTLYDHPGSLNYLSLPSLRKLSIKTSGFKNRSWIKRFESFLSRNGQALESFVLDVETVMGSELVACLKTLQALSGFTLTISGHCHMSYTADMKEILQHMASPNPVMLPALDTITIVCTNTVTSDVGANFVDMIESRWQASKNLSYRVGSTGQPDISRIRCASLAIHGLRDFTVDPVDKDRLRKLRAEGLAVQVSFPQ
jgi:hypothetical protein